MSIRAAAGVLLVGIATGVGIDVAGSFYMRQKLDAAAQSALAAALSQSRALRASRWRVDTQEMEAKGRVSADLVFNAQKPGVRAVKTSFSLTPLGNGEAYDARLVYSAAVGTVFLRFAGLKTITVQGEVATEWAARDALIDDNFRAYEGELAGGPKVFPAPAGWTARARAAPSVPAGVPLAAAARYEGPAPPQGVAVAVELDGAAGNLIISKKVALEPGPHLLRYWYRDRARDEFTAPAWLCATRDEDVDWMSARGRSAAVGTNRMAVYLTADAAQTPPKEEMLQARSRIDSCYSSGHRWVERVVKIDVFARGDYWLSFRGEGRSDGVGAAVANILFCREPCIDAPEAAAPPADNYPWSPGELLFEDHFVTAGPDPLATSGANAGWGRLVGGWTAWPANVVAYERGANGAPGHVSLDVPAGEGRFENRTLGRPFLLVPGFYRLRYVYSVGPNSAAGTLACNYFGLNAALQRLPRLRGADTHRINVMIDPDAAYLHPEPAQVDASRVSWFTPGRVPEADLGAARPPRMPDVSGAVDFCAGAPAHSSHPREIDFRVEKPGLYWIAFMADGPADGAGGRISEVQLFARGAKPAVGATPRVIRAAGQGGAPKQGGWLTFPPPDGGGRALYRVQAQ